MKIKDLVLEKSEEICLIKENWMKEIRDIKEEETENETVKTVYKSKSKIALRKCRGNEDINSSNFKSCRKNTHVVSSIVHLTIKKELLRDVPTVRD